MQLYKITVKLNSALVTPLKGDTLWGHIVWGIANHEGEEAVAKFLKQQKTSPNFVVSSAFPKGTICKPLYEPEIHSDSLTTESYADIKKKKKEKYVNSQSLMPDSQSQVFKYTFTMHNSIDRRTNSSLEDGLYSTEEIWAKENAEFDIYICTDYENKRVLEFLEWAFENGFGKDASTGKGSIKILSKTLTEIKKKTHTGKYVALAPFAFNSARELKNLRAEIFVREGKIGGSFATYLSPFKRNILFFDDGSVFESEDKLEFIGELLTNVHNMDNRICSSGFAPVLPV